MSTAWVVQTNVEPASASPAARYASPTYLASKCPVLPAELIQFAERAAQQWAPAPAFVMDVARIERSWKIVECNCFNGSRFYDADVVAIVRAVSDFQSERWR